MRKAAFQVSTTEESISVVSNIHMGKNSGTVVNPKVSTMLAIVTGSKK